MERSRYIKLFGFLSVAVLSLSFYLNVPALRLGVFDFEDSEQGKALPARSAALDGQTEVREDAFGITARGLRVYTDRVPRGQTFAELLTAHGVAYDKVLALVEAARPVIDVRRIEAGKKYRFYEARRVEVPRYLVYQQDPVHYVVFDLTGAPRVWEGTRDVAFERKKIHGTIDHSLYGALEEAGASSMLAFKLARVFAWQIDFFHLQPGDRFEIVYRQRHVGGKAIAPGRILAARFTHRGEDFYAFYFEQGDQGAYYDENGESLRKAFLKAPLDYVRITSGYTKRRFHPILNRWEAHLGTDYAAPAGTPVYSTGDGTVLVAGYSRYNGNWVKIRHNATFITGYLHFSSIAEGIEPGVHVEQGQVIGYVGSTGLATGPHVCYRFWKNGRQVDPYAQELPPSEPVAPAYRMAFSRIKRGLMPLVTPGEGAFMLARAERPSARVLYRPLPVLQ